MILFDKYTLDVGNIEFKEYTNYISAYVPVRVKNSGKYIVTLMPERRFYKKRSEESFGEVAIHSTLSHDLYIVLASYSKPENYIGLQIIIHPLISLVWIGFVIMVIGGILNFLPIKANESENASD